MAPIKFTKPPRSLCLLRLSAIGDVTHMLPIVATLQQQWPETRITWIIGRVEYQLIKSLSNVDFIVFDKHNGLKELSTVRQQLRGRQFDVLLMMQAALRASLISLLVNANVRIGYDRPRSRDLQWLFCDQRIEGPYRVHVVDTFFQFLEKIGIAERHMDWLLTADESDSRFASETIDDKPTVLINPSSSDRKNNWRNWTLEGYVAIIDFLSENKVQVILTGGPAEQEKRFATNIASSCLISPINLVGKTTLTHLLALAEKSLCLVAPDTGPAHIGTVAGIPVIGLYASSNPERTGPYNSLKDTINAYPRALSRFASKTVSQAAWGERVRNSEVMKLISVADVIDRLRPIVNG